MAVVEIVFDKQVFGFEKNDKEWQLTLKRSAIASQELKNLQLLNLHHPMFLEQDYEVNLAEDTVTFHYHTEPDGMTLEKVARLSMAEKFRLALNCLELEACLQLPVTFFLDPENLFISKDGRYKLAYRGLVGVMTPKQMTEADFLRQVKCYIISLFTDYAFSDLYDGTLSVVELPEFLGTIRQLDDLNEIKEKLEVFYREKREEETQTMTVVPKMSYKLYRYATVWLGALSVILLIPLIYLTFIRSPFKEKMLEADTAFIKVDYSEVISELKPVALKKLPYTQKYELAYSYIKSLDFAKDKEEVILNNVTLKTDELYLDYWISVGRGDQDEALDIAKRLSDSDLILYALAQSMTQVRADDKLSGADREQKLKDLQSEYDQYWDKRQNDLTESSSSDSSESSETSQSSSTASSSSQTQATSNKKK